MSITLAGAGHSSNRLYEVVHRILDGNFLSSMATTMDDGTLHMNNAFFCFDDSLTLYFLSHPKSDHARNIERTGQMAVAVCDGSQPWGQQHAGVQLVGRAERAEGVVERIAQRRYGVRFPLYIEFVEGRLAEGAPKPSFFELKFYAFRPQKVRIMAEADFGDEVIVNATVA